MTTWVRRWGYEMAKTAVRPGVYRLKARGYYVRSRVTDKLHRRREVAAALHDVRTAAEAQKELDALVARAQAELRGEIRKRQLWSDFVVSLLDRKIRQGKIESEATVDWWKGAVALFIEEWGHLDVSDVTRHHIQRWLDTKVAKWMSDGRTVMRKRKGTGKLEGQIVLKPFTTVIKPRTINGWLRVLRTICHAAKKDFDLSKSAFEGIEFFEEGRAYTKEQPNAMPPGTLLSRFIEVARRRYPQHFAMILLGFITGLRPSHMRPLRRKGPTSDIDWKTGELVVRRSHSRRQAVMNRTKTKVDLHFVLPELVMDVLREHVRGLEGKMLESDLLFPSATGGFRTRMVLTKPFAAISKELGLPFKLTPRGMRRTFNDLARVAGIDSIVKRSISGHQTTEMEEHYSTAWSPEKLDALEKVHGLVAGASPDDQPGGNSTRGLH